MTPWLYWILHIPSAVVRFVVHLVLAAVYCGKGKRVPAVTNPLLLKSATELAAEIREGKTKSEDVVHAYMERILEVDPYINATVDRRFLDAMKEAKEADLLVTSGKYTREQLALEKPLLGVPFTVKVLLTVKGLRCTAGSLLFENVRACEDAPSVALLKGAGAIVLATTNSAEFGMHFETNNKLHGKTCNPYDTNRTSGGSSGGESALIAAGGSLMGLGNDLLGSVRVPSHYTGIFAHKPTVGLVPNLGCHPPPHPKMQHFLYTGPMCRYAQDLLLTMRILSTQSDAPIKLGKEVNFRNLKIFHVKEIISPMISNVDTEISDGIIQAVSYFRNKYGSSTTEMDLPYLYDANRCALHHLLYPIGGDLKGLLTAGKGDSLDERWELLKLPFGMSRLSHGPVVALNFAFTPAVYRQSNQARYERLLCRWREELDQLLDEDSVLMMPTIPFAAPYHYESATLLPSTCFTSVFNVTGHPATQCPLGINRNGLPFGMQIVAGKNNDNLSLACAAELERAFGGWKDPGDV